MIGRSKAEAARDLYQERLHQFEAYECANDAVDRLVKGDGLKDAIKLLQNEKKMKISRSSYHERRTLVRLFKQVDKSFSMLF